MQLPNEIDGLGIDGDDFVAPPVAQQSVDPLKCRGNVAAVDLVGDGQALAGVDMIEGDGAGFAAGRNMGDPKPHARADCGCKHPRQCDPSDAFIQYVTVSGVPGVETHTLHTHRKLPVPCLSVSSPQNGAHPLVPDYTIANVATRMRPPCGSYCLRLY